MRTFFLIISVIPQLIAGVTEIVCGLVLLPLVIIPLIFAFACFKQVFLAIFF
jgi:hypothetical protein